MCLEIYELDPVKFNSVPRLAWQVHFKKTQVKLDLLTDIDMLLMVECVLEEEYAIQFTTMQKLTIDIWRATTKIKNRYTSNTGM